MHWGPLANRLILHTLEWRGRSVKPSDVYVPLRKNRNREFWAWTLSPWNLVITESEGRNADSQPFRCLDTESELNQLRAKKGVDVCNLHSRDLMIFCKSRLSNRVNYYLVDGLWGWTNQPVQPVQPIIQPIQPQGSNPSNPSNPSNQIINLSNLTIQPVQPNTEINNNPTKCLTQNPTYFSDAPKNMIVCYFLRSTKPYKKSPDTYVKSTTQITQTNE